MGRGEESLRNTGPFASVSQVTSGICPVRAPVSLALIQFKPRPSHQPSKAPILLCFPLLIWNYSSFSFSCTPSQPLDLSVNTQLSVNSSWDISGSP